MMVGVENESAFFIFAKMQKINQHFDEITRNIVFPLRKPPKHLQFCPKFRENHLTLLFFFRKKLIFSQEQQFFKAVSRI
jgi:hypothetical protein